ncbi:MAG: hypothetical protein GX181_06840 [Synergistaceae bacterium]|nr:hypothetical protein [Synergistota bacterium]NLM71657.1 hypothetical protein [Synergistaceae bacterium]
MYPISATFLLKSEGNSSSYARLFVRRLSRREELQRTARSKVAYSVALKDEATSEVVIFDDGGNEIEPTAPAFQVDSPLPFSLFHAGGIPCAASGEKGLLSSEAGRLLALAGVRVLCCFPSESATADYPMADFARVRSLENGHYTIIALPGEQGVACFGKGDAPLSTCEIVLRRVR